VVTSVLEEYIASIFRIDSKWGFEVFIQEENTQWNVEKRKNGKEER
jgi:hypothetical protein